jgi:hypothetical protein
MTATVGVPRTVAKAEGKHMKAAWKTTTALTAVVGLLASTGASFAQSDELIAAAKKEGMLTTIALPHDWCGYGERDRRLQGEVSEIEVNELNPDAGSADEIEAIKANKGNTGPQAPDVIDVGLVVRSVGEGRRPAAALQGGDVGRTIPDSAKDAEGYWYGDYYGVLVLRGEHRHRQGRPAGLGRPVEAREYANSGRAGR